jgi:hypothetical protein
MLKAFTDYAWSQAEFSSTDMSVDQMAEIHKSEVSNHNWWYIAWHDNDRTESTSQFGAHMDPDWYKNSHQL